VRFGIEDNFVESQSPGRGEEQVEIFESLRQSEALHFVALHSWNARVPHFEAIFIERAERRSGKASVTAR
jgi:RecA/RadA recombinase